MKLQQAVAVFLSLCTPEGFLLYELPVFTRFVHQRASSCTKYWQYPQTLRSFPHPTHQEQNRPPTHFSLLIHIIRKTATCHSVLSTPHPHFPHVLHQEQNRTSAHILFLIRHIRNKIALPHTLQSLCVTSGNGKSKIMGYFRFWGLKTEVKEYFSRIYNKGIQQDNRTFEIHRASR